MDNLSTITPQFHLHHTSDEPACHKCGCIDSPIIERGPFGPHAAKAVCRHCGAWLRWISDKTPEQRQTARERGIERTLDREPATEAQRRFLRQLGKDAPADLGKGTAMGLIREALAAKGVGR